MKDMRSASAIERARALAPLLSSLAAETEKRRSVHPDCIAAMKAADLFRILQPRRLGGLELDMRTMHGTVSELAQSCPSSAWVLMVLLAHSWILGMFPEAAQDEIKADDTDTIVAGSLAAAGQATPVDRGWCISGHWPFSSGLDHARWSLIGVQVAEPQPGGPRQIHVLVPASDYVINDNWFTMGLRGTGSKEVICENVFVPAHRAMDTEVLFSGRSDAARRHSTWLHMMPVTAGLAFHVSAAILGVAKAYMAEFIERTRVRDDKYTGKRKADSPGLQLRIARSQLDIEAAAALLSRVAKRFDVLSAEKRLPTTEERVELRYTIAYAVDRCREAIDRLFAVAGANATYDLSKQQTFFRDINVGSHHAVVDLDGAAEQFGRVRLGLAPNSSVV